MRDDARTMQLSELANIMNTRLTYFTPGTKGMWRIREVREVTGEGLPLAKYLNVSSTHPAAEPDWVLKGVTSNVRYTTTDEKAALVKKQEELGRPASTLAVLIPIKKTDEWWNFSQDRRREIFEEKSRHASIGMNYLPAIARRLFHCRDLESFEPFDFLTWFEFSPDQEEAFDELLGELRSSLEWTFIEREVEVRLERAFS